MMQSQSAPCPPMSSGLSDIEQGQSTVGKSSSSSALPMQHLSPPSDPSSFVIRAVAASDVMVHPHTPAAPEGLLHPGNYSFNGNVQPLQQTNHSHRPNMGVDGPPEVGAMSSSAPAYVQSASQSRPNSSTPLAHFAPNSYNNMAKWASPTAPFQVTPGMANNPLTPGPPGIASSVPSSNSAIQVSSADSAALLRAFTSAAPVFSNPTIQHNVYPSPSPHATPPGPWLQTQHISGFARPQYSQYPTLMPGPYPIPNRGMLPDIQPPGVSPVVSAVVVPISSSAAGQSSVTSGQAELPPGIETVKHAGTSEMKDESVSKELDAWTAHRTETGTIYYYNALTGESTYEKPPGFKGESDKATAQPTPISWEKLTGTDWTLVTTNDGKRYYYNSRTQLSSWQIPTEVTELRKKQDASPFKAQSPSLVSTNMTTEKGSDAVSLSTPAATTGGRDATSVKSASASGASSALDLIKKKLQDSVMPDSASSGPALSGAVAVELNGSKPAESTAKGLQNEINKDKLKDSNGDGDLSNSSSDSEDEDGGPTKEECILQFKEMLKERGVAPFSKWEKELPKIVFDPRFKAIPNHSARRAIFEHYVRTRAEEARKEKRAAQKAALEGFKQLLEEAKEDIDHNTDYQTFKRKWEDDPRFKALERKDRELLLNERVYSLKRTAQERAQSERAAAVSSFKSMLRDKAQITSSSRWSKVKDSLKLDPRYKSVKHEDREKLFNEYIAELKAAEEEVMQKERAKQDEEEKLKERERALRKRKEREEQEVEKVRQKARRKEAVESCQALLVETIKDPQASWTESKLKLEKDPQGRAANPHLDKSDLEKLFREHVKTLHERCVMEYKALLREVITAEAAQETKDGKSVITSWSTAKQVLKGDPRYNKMARKERESLWRRHSDDIHRKLKKVQDQEVDPGKRARS